MQTHILNVDLMSNGRTFEGIGGISSNGTSKLLQDYPAKQQADIIDLLFKPDFGASLQQLKLEIGSDANTSSGTEPCHMRSEKDFDITRGTGLWLAQRAKKANPTLMLSALRWGTPSWITDNSKKFTYYKTYLEGAFEKYGLSFDYVGADVNEGPFDRDWTVDILRKNLDLCGFSKLGIVAADSEKDWSIADMISNDEALKQSLCALGIHYTQESPENAKNSKLPLWLSEDIAPFHTSFQNGPLQTAHRIIAMYAVGKMVKFELHPLFEGNYESTPFAYKGILTAAWPWSGHYKIEPGLWIVAHFTQFIKPGWLFVDDGCFSDDSLGCIVLKEPVKGDISIIILNISSKAYKFDIQLTNGLIPQKMHMWVSDERDQFIQHEDVKIQNGFCSVILEPNSICSLTTTTGQQKGQPLNSVPEEKDFPLPFYEDLILCKTGKAPCYTLDQAGAFEVYQNSKGEKSLRQIITKKIKPIDWTHRPTPEPYTLIGSMDWANFIVCVNVLIEETEGYILVGGRANYAPKSGDIAHCYNLIVSSNGKWVFRKSSTEIGSGIICDFAVNRWYKIELSFQNDFICIKFNGILLFSCQSQDIPSGQVVLGSGYHHAQFSNLTVKSLNNEKSVSCKRIDDRDKALQYSKGFTSSFVSYEAYLRSLTVASAANETMKFKFSGSKVSIIGKKDKDCGKARVYIDDKEVEVIDTYSPITQYRESIFSCYDLFDGEHTLVLVTEGKHGEDSTDSKICIDALEVL